MDDFYRHLHSQHQRRGPVDNTGLYTLLGIQRDADSVAIRSAYRKLALRHHPDRGGDPEEVAIFLL